MPKFVNHYVDDKGKPSNRKDRKRNMIKTHMAIVSDLETSYDGVYWERETVNGSWVRVENTLMGEVRRLDPTHECENELFDGSQMRAYPYSFGLLPVRRDVPNWVNPKDTRPFITNSFSAYLDKLKEYAEMADDIDLWFHNAGFDFRFLMYGLMCLYNAVNVGQKLKGQINPDGWTVGSMYAKGKFFKAVVWWKGKKITIRDSYRLLIGGLDKQFQSFKTKDDEWIEQTYKAKKDKYHQRYHPQVQIIPLEDRRYLESDLYKTEVIVRWLYNSGMAKKLTVAGFSMESAKAALQEQFKWTLKRVENHVFTNQDGNTGKLIQASNTGGMILTNVNKLYYRHNGSIYCYHFVKLDVNSEYPWAISHHKIPLGRIYQVFDINGIDWRILNKRHFRWFKGRFRFKLPQYFQSPVSDKYWKIIGAVKRELPTQRVVESDGSREMILAECEIQFLMKWCPEVIAEIHNVYESESVCSATDVDNTFYQYIIGLYKERQDIKREQRKRNDPSYKSAEAEKLKFQMNAFIGKTGQYINEAKCWLEINEDGIPEVVKEGENKMKYGQMGIASAVCAYSRCYICDIINTYFTGKCGWYVYGDTDSIFVDTTIEDLKKCGFYDKYVDNAELGKFKVEGADCYELEVFAPKTYQYWTIETKEKKRFRRDDGVWIDYTIHNIHREYHSAICGFSQTKEMKGRRLFDESNVFDDGTYRLPPRKKARAVRGGVAILNSPCNGKIMEVPNNQSEDGIDYGTMEEWSDDDE